MHLIRTITYSISKHTKWPAELHCLNVRKAMLLGSICMEL